MSAEMEKVIIKKDTITRLIKDVKDIIANPLSSHGIYYQHHETNILKGQALIIGPKDTPYENGYYLFQLTYPANYPHSPPVVKFFTNDGMTRFNPNLYICGKVCLSILNTWRGDQWSACQSISTVLLALCTIFNEEPLLNEPGITRVHPDFINYNQTIRYKSLEFAMMQMFARTVLNTDPDINYFEKFSDIIEKHFLENYTRNNAIIDQYLHSKEEDDEKKIKKGIMRVDIYNMTTKIDYEALSLKLQNLYVDLQKLKKNYKN